MTCDVKTIGRKGRSLTISGVILVTLFTLILEGGLLTAEAIDCGDVIGAGKEVKLDRDLHCSGDVALTVIGPATLNLKGHTIYGHRAMDCIVVEGKQAKVMNGTVTNCDNGLMVKGDGQHKIVKIAAADNDGDGFTVDSDGNSLILNTATGNGEDGFDVDGNGNRLVNNMAENCGDEGIEIDGDQNELTNNKSTGNRQDSIEIDGDENKLFNNTAANDADDGIVIDGNRNMLHNNNAFGNAGDGIEVDGDGNKLTNNKAEDNGESGIDLFSGNANNALTKNVARQNGDYDLMDNTQGCGSNQWSKNKFVTSNQDCI